MLTVGDGGSLGKPLEALPPNLCPLPNVSQCRVGTWTKHCKVYKQECRDQRG